MTSSDLDPNADAAALYALNALEADECGQFEQALLDGVELEQAVHEFEETAAALAYGASSVPMAADLKDRLFQRIADNPVDLSSAMVKLLALSIDQLKQQASQLNWLSMSGNSGAEVATWQMNEKEREVAFFVRKADSGLFPNHAHASGETVLVLEGDFIVNSHVYGVGEQVSSAGGTSHQPGTQGGCLLFCVSSMDDDMLDG